MAQVLVVEDDQLLGRSLQNLLQSGGIESIWVQSGEEALNVLETEFIDLVYLDIVLPGMDGLDLLKDIRQMDSHKTLRVVILSNMGDLSHLDSARNLGVQDYLVKATIDFDKFVEITEEKLGVS